MILEFTNLLFIIHKNHYRYHCQFTASATNQQYINGTLTTDSNRLQLAVFSLNLPVSLLLPL
ncbi:hypothetical protein BGI40_00055 [Snodgrassella communis]|uniref:Uncharacterized protein n=1 Tax=Snodgrassella communis TaxID=2946699 RepID=A0A066TRT7_9NEIS|nr:hypothetical protein SALWKB12_1797 [Snodgrassella communis]PIT07286.1 hypothetical protein BGI30_10725 [Snodgrassella alvi]KDN14738.1 hypothetical protein SALWKB29_1197 [Snodgrassella communis]PIT07545.1 hypothetical protein BGI29_09180 [Snodgrassella communis]PIT20394.1 hypothetical protein BGI35_08615 [Snodgrassella communis]